MRKQDVLAVLEEWNAWTHEIDSGVIREAYREECLRLLEPNVVVAITGVRRSGKSVLMRQVAKALVQKGVEPKRILHVNFEDPRLGERSNRLLDDVFDAYVEFVRPQGKPFLFLDEIPIVPEWERWVRAMHELGKAKIVVSGSSAKLLSGELSSVLTGRHLDVAVFPLSFREFLSFRGITVEDEVQRATHKIELRRLFGEYVEFGGFPEVTRSNEKTQLLLTYFDDILTKDIEKRFHVRQSQTLRALARFYLTNTANPMTFNALKTTLNTTTNTIEKFSTYLQEANLVFFLKRFSFKIKEQDKSARKVYAIDPGLANAVGFRFSANAGALAETITAIELKRRAAHHPRYELYYYKDRTGREVDFVVKTGLNVEQLIQVCWNPEQPHTKQREITALLKAADELHCTRLTILTEDLHTTETHHGHTIQFVPLHHWLLTPDTNPQRSNDNNRNNA